MILYNKIVPVSFGELYDRLRERERSEKWSAGNGSLSWCIYRRIDHGTGQGHEEKYRDFTQNPTLRVALFTFISFFY